MLQRMVLEVYFVIPPLFVSILVTLLYPPGTMTNKLSTSTKCAAVFVQLS